MLVRVLRVCEWEQTSLCLCAEVNLILVIEGRCLCFCVCSAVWVVDCVYAVLI